MGLVARFVEAAGIPTILVSTGRDLTQQVMPPRSVFVNFPMGNPFGHAEDKEEQHKILKDAFGVAESATEAGLLVDLPYAWPQSFAEAVEKSLLAMTAPAG